MTAALAVYGAGVATGAALAGLAVWRVMVRATDLHDYRKVRLAEARWRDVVCDADHEHRLRLRWERRAITAREHIGGLVVQLGDARAELARRRRPAHLRRSPVPVYGAHRRREQVA